MVLRAKKRMFLASKNEHYFVFPARYKSVKKCRLIISGFKILDRQYLTVFKA